MSSKNSRNPSRMIVRFTCLCGCLSLVGAPRVTAEEAIPDYLAHTVIKKDPQEKRTYLFPYAYYPTTGQLEVRFDRQCSLARTWLSSEPSPALPDRDLLPGLKYAYFVDEIATPEYWLNQVDPVKMADVADMPQPRTGVLPNVTLEPVEEPVNWAMLWHGVVTVPTSGVYTFTMRPYSNGRLFIDGKLVADTVNCRTWQTWMGGAIHLEAGSHAWAAASTYWRTTLETPAEWPEELVRVCGPGIQNRAVPNEWLSHPARDEGFPELPWRESDEVLFDQAAPPLSASFMTLSQAVVRVVSLPGEEEMGSWPLPLNERGRGWSTFDIGELPDGEYAVDVLLGGKPIRSPIPFTRQRFPWEGCDLGLEHRVYPPFEPVKLDGRDLSLVQRTYQVNALGGFDSVISKGRELLAGPIELKGRKADGSLLRFDAGPVTGRVLHPDLAEFSASADAEGLSAATSVRIEEDGCARYALTLTPPPGGMTLDGLWLEIPLKDTEAPLFHYACANAMRYNYGGRTPRGGRIVWEEEPPGRHPLEWRAVGTADESPGSDDGWLWDSSKPYSHRNAFHAYMTPYCYYVWLGAQERGFSWFGDNERGYLVNGEDAVQVLERQGDTLYLRIHFIQGPARLETSRTIHYGLQATPTKPMPDDWRSKPFKSGVGPVTCWGGYFCSCKYPDGRDFEIVEKMLEAKRTGMVDEAWFRDRDQRRVWSDLTMHDQGKRTWLDLQMLFAGRLAQRKDASAVAIYYEENRSNTRTEEWRTFMDEWASTHFPRFYGEFARSVYAPSYQAFAMYYANEWMRRGVSLYFDNTYPTETFNIHTSPAYYDAQDGRLHWATEVGARHDYYKRIWKLMSRLNEEGRSPYVLSFTQHMTNTRVAPIQTWCYATLDFEQRYRKDANGKHLPWPPEYLQAVSVGGQTGTRPIALDMVRGASRHHFAEECGAKGVLSEWAMQRVHEMEGPSAWGPTATLISLAADAVKTFGYGQPGVTYHRYWDEKPFARVSDDQVLWWAMERPDDGKILLVLQNWTTRARDVTVTLPGGAQATDVISGVTTELAPAGSLETSLDDDYGTRVFLVEGFSG